MRLLDRIKKKLPGEPVSVSLGVNFNISRLKTYGTSRRKIFHHDKAKPIIGWPGQYYNWSTSFLRLGPLNVSIHWLPFDRLSEEEYLKKYGTNENVEPTRWDIEKESRRRLSKLDKININ